jgi:hypothetical protein
VRWLLVTANVVPNSPILVALIEAIRCSERWFLQEPHGVTSQKTRFFIVAVVKTSNLTFEVFLRSVRRLLVIANVVPSSPNLVNLMIGALSSTETSVLTRAIRRNIPVHGILDIALFLFTLHHLLRNKFATSVKRRNKLFPHPDK